jgi:ADP-L-glycero-D-manno-heptose 6-epimerase
MYLVTGGAGFIGSNIVKALNERGVTEILVVDDLAEGERFRNLCDCRIADYMDRAEFRRTLAAGKLNTLIQGICHQGACSDTMESDGRYMMDNNFTFSKELLNAALEWKVPFVYASSASVYGSGRTFREEPEYERPLNVYGLSKLVFDQHVRRMLPQARSTVVGLRYFNVYGPRERHKGRMASMVYQLYRQLRQTKKARLFEGTDGYGPGEQRRDFVFVGDVVKVNLFFLHDEEPVQGIFNVGFGASRSFNDIARTLIDRLGEGEIEYIPMPESLRGKYQSFTEGDIAGLRQAGFVEPMTSLEEGIEACVPKWEAEEAQA